MDETAEEDFVEIKKKKKSVQIPLVFDRARMSYMKDANIMYTTCNVQTVRFGWMHITNENSQER